MVIIPRLLPLPYRTGDDALVVARDVACYAQSHPRRQVLDQVGDELIIAVRRLDENLGLLLTLDASRHLFKAGLTCLDINGQVTLKGKPLSVKT